jgi:hypothetical protein
VAAFIDGMIAGGLESYSTAYSGSEPSNNGVAGNGLGAVPRSGVSTTLPYVAHHWNRGSDNDGNGNEDFNQRESSLLGR